MHILCLTCVWKRPAITRKWLQWQKQLQKHAETIGIEYSVLVVGSEGHKSKRMATDHGFMYLEATNNPLSIKWQAGVYASKNLPWSHLLIMGSDDFLSRSGLDHYKKHQDKDFVAFADIYFYDYNGGKMKHWPGYGGIRQGEPIGAGRLVKRELVSALKYMLWHKMRDKGLDYIMHNRLQSVEHSSYITTMADAKCMLVDVKSGFNMSGFNDHKGKIVNIGMDEFEHHYIDK